MNAKLITQPDLDRLRSQLPLLFAEAGLADDPAAEGLWTETYLETVTGRLARKGLRLLHRDDTGWVLLREGKDPVEQDGVYHRSGPPAGPAGSRARKAARGERLLPLIRIERRARPFRAGRAHAVTVTVEEFVFTDPVDGRRVGGPVRVEAEGDEPADREIRDFVMSRVGGAAVASFDPVRAGLAALGLPEPGAPVPEPLRLSPGDAPAEAARKLLARQTAALRANRRGAVLDLDPEYLHQIRVAIRRARAVLRVFAADLESPRSGSVRRELGEMGRRLGRTRDLDVLLPILAGELARVEASAEMTAWVLGEFRRRREATADDARRELASSGTERLMGLLESLRPAANPPETAPSTVAEAAGPVLERATAKVARWRERPVESLADADLHRIRIALKRLRYASEIFAEIEPAGFRKAIRRLARFQDVLGEAQDARVAIGHLRALAEVVASDPHPDVDRLLVLGALVHRRERAIRRRRRRFASLWNEFGKLTRKIRRKARRAAAASPEKDGTEDPA